MTMPGYNGVYSNFHQNMPGYDGSSSFFSETMRGYNGGASKFSETVPEYDGVSSNFPETMLAYDAGYSNFSGTMPAYHGESSIFSETMPAYNVISSNFSEPMPGYQAVSSMYSDTKTGYDDAYSNFPETMPGYDGSSSNCPETMAEYMPEYDDVSSNYSESMPEYNVIASNFTNTMPGYNGVSSNFSKTMPDYDVVSSIFSEPPPKVTITWYSSYDTHSNFSVQCYNKGITTTVTHTHYVVNTFITDILNTHGSQLNRLIVGLDIEWRPNTAPNMNNPVATLQLCVDEKCLIFQFLYASYIPQSLFDFLSNHHIRFVGVGIQDDVEKLWRDYNLNVANPVEVRDLAVQKFGMNELRNVSLINLARTVLGVDLEKDKRISRSRWDAPSLSHAQVMYACLDAFVSYMIGANLIQWWL